MITAIEIENFKGIDTRERIELAPITLLFGANSSGKSTVMHALLYLHSILVENKLEPMKSGLRGDDFDLGGFQHVVHNQDTDRSIILLLEMTVDSTDVMSATDTINPASIPSRIGLEVTIGEGKEGTKVVCYRFFANGKPFIDLCSERELIVYGDSCCLPKQTEWPSKIKAKRNPFHLLTQGQEKLLVTSGGPDNAPVPKSVSEFMTKFVNVWKKLILDQALKHLRRMIQLGPIRQVPELNFESVRPILELSRVASGRHAWDLLLWMNSDSLGKVNYWMGPAGLDLGYSISQRIISMGDGSFVRQERRIEFTRNDGTKMIDNPSAYFRAQDIGVGVSQVLPVLAHCLEMTLFDGSTPELVCIEQPELHLHPRAQARLADLLIAAIFTGDDGYSELEPPKQIIAETHSEHLVLRLLRRIRETGRQENPSSLPLFANQLSVNFVSKNSGKSEFQRIDVSNDGEFVQPWPDDFFEIDFQERFA